MREFLLPFAYFVLLGFTWSKIFKKNFYESLPVAIMFHTLFVIIVGMTLERLSLGIYGLIVACIGAIFILYFRQDNKIAKIREDAVDWAFGGV